MPEEAQSTRQARRDLITEVSKSQEENNLIPVPHPQTLPDIFRTFLDCLTDGATVTDSSGCILAVNSAWAKCAESQGLEQSCSLGSNYLAICDSASGPQPELGGSIASNLRRMIQERRGGFECDYPVIRSNCPRWFRLKAACFEHESSCYTLLIHQEITEFKMLQKAVERAEAELQRLTLSIESIVSAHTAELKSSLRSLQAFSHSIAHDLRSPLRAIHCFSDLLLTEHSGKLGASSDFMLQEIGRAIERLDLLTHTLLTFAQVSCMDVTRKPIDVNNLLSLFSADQTGGNALSQAEIRYICRHVPPVLADAPMLSQALSTLFSTLSKLGRPGVPVEFRVWGEARETMVRICVEDNGVALNPDEQSKLSRAYETCSLEEYPEVGLGLCVVQKAIQRMGGSAGVDSIGTSRVFWIDLPSVS